MFGLLPPSSSATGGEPSSGLRCDGRARPLAACEGDLRDGWMLYERFARLALAGDDVEDAPRKPDLCCEPSVSITLALACSDGLTTMVFPAASAGASEYIVNSTGEFQGMMIPTTPRGSRSV